MNLATSIVLQAGGPGSGCHGPSCGRKGNIKITRSGSSNKLVIERRGNFVGKLVYVRQGSSAYVKDITVLSSERGQGYGKELYRKAFEDAKERGITVMRSSPFSKDSSHFMTPDSKRVWKKLSKEFPVKRLKDHFELDLTRLP